MQGSARAEQRARVEELLRLVDLVGYGDRAPDTLSGGEAQRVALARSLAPAPRLLLLDEPLGSLDRQLRDDLTGQLRTVLSDVDQTAIHVTHDLDEAYAIADRIAVMAHGRLLRIGTPQEIWRDPRSEFVARFLGHTAITERGGQRVVLRADGIRVAEGGEPATVESVVFRGALSMVDARLDRDGTPITFPASTELRPGDRITVEIAPSAIVPLDDRG